MRCSGNHNKQTARSKAVRSCCEGGQTGWRVVRLGSRGGLTSLDRELKKKIQKLEQIESKRDEILLKDLCGHNQLVPKRSCQKSKLEPGVVRPPWTGSKKRLKTRANGIELDENLTLAFLIMANLLL